MPTYEYVCRSCDTHLEVVQRFDDTALAECPSCGGALRKVFGNIGVIFKGSGFYKNDSRSVAKSGNGTGSKAEGAKEAAKGAGGEGKDSGSGSGDGAATKAKDAAPSTKESTGSKASDASSKPAAKTA